MTEPEKLFIEYRDAFCREIQRLINLMKLYRHLYEKKSDRIDAMVADFQNGNFAGIEGTILRIIPIQSPLPFLGINTPSQETAGNSAGLG